MMGFVTSIDQFINRGPQGEDVFKELMETVKVVSQGQVTDTLFNVGGQYRREM